MILSESSGVDVTSFCFPPLVMFFRFWIDTADKQPCIGTGGMIAWRLRATGKLFHSGLAHKVLPNIDAPNVLFNFGV